MSDVQSRLHALAERWAAAKAAERANAQSYLIELCEALAVERPRPAGSGYEFEYPVKVVNRDGTETTDFADLVKLGHFVLEAKDEEPGKSGDVLLRKAFGQARAYAAHLPGAPPPYLLVLDVAKTLTVWDRWSGAYGGFSAGRTMNLRTLAEREADVALLRDIFEDPGARDPRAKAAAVTEEIAGIKALADATAVAVDTVVTHFAGARRDLVARHLDTLALMGELQQLPDGRYGAPIAAA